MHGQPMIIVARKELLGPDHPDFAGPDFLSAKLDMLKSEGTLPGYEEDEDADPVGKSHSGMSMEDMHAELMEIADQLDAASEKHAGQAERIRALCECMQKDTADKDSVDFDTPDPVAGEEREL
jgi:hypothetical protein